MHYAIAVMLFPWMLLGGTKVTSAVQEIGVCEVTNHPERYANTVVKVSGIYIRGPHGTTIASDDCGFANRVPAFGNGAAANLELYGYDGNRSSALNKLFDIESIRILDRYCDRADKQSASPPADVFVTVMGPIKLANNYSLHKISDDNWEGNGYGFMGRYQVEIILLRVIRFHNLARK